jgi:heme-degrading monooxygenase HmoA
MIQIVWQYEVKEDGRARFELAYGPGGVWSNLFARAPGYRGTALLRDIEDPRKYLTVDMWDTEVQFQDFLDQHREQYAELDAALDDLLVSEARLGVYRLLAQATVRSAPKSAHGRAGSRRRDR